MRSVMRIAYGRAWLLVLVLALAGGIGVATPGADAGDGGRPSDAGNVRVTPPLFINSGGSDENGGCLVVTIGRKTRTVVIEAFDNDGALIESDSPVLAPGTIGIVSFFADSSAYCKFTVVKGSRTDIRGQIAIGALARNVLALPAE